MSIDPSDEAAPAEIPENIGAPGRTRTCNLLIFPPVRAVCLASMSARGFGVKRGEPVRAGMAAIARQCVPNLHSPSIDV
jgi:hypothetical protein